MSSRMCGFLNAKGSEIDSLLDAEAYKQVVAES